MKVAIIGAGLGGLASAIALRKRGVDVQVFERARELRPIGAGLTLAPNGLKALNAIDPDIVARLLELGSQNSRLYLRRANGDLITEIPITFMDRYGQPMLNIVWSCLQKVLTGFLKADAVRLDHRLVGFERTNDGLSLHFDGRDPVTADVLVGADGINSTVRQIMVGDGPPRYAGRLCWRSVVSYQHPSLLPDEVTFFAGVDGRNFSMFDVGSGLVFWSATALWPAWPISDGIAPRQRVTEAFAGWAPLVQDVLAATPPEDIVERPIEDRAPLASWRSHRVTLLGDAAHAMVPSLGQGANMAFEDAWELAQALAGEPDTQAALIHYESSRIPRTQVVHARSAAQGYRYYDADNETFSRSVLEQASADQRAFEDWLYGWSP
ncbi:FAD-dependent monooxygenase [Rhodopila globiformis]|nr:FAD-dependent monooxygenase [Rhodopila globiformis]